MNIAIIGSGNVGTALAQRFHNAGHSVVFGVRNPKSQKAAKARDNNTDILQLSISDAARKSDVIVITTPPDAVLSLVPQLGSTAGKTIIDTTNSVMKKPEGFTTAYHALSFYFPKAFVVKCFNSTGFENMADPVYPMAAIDMFCAGDSTEAKDIAKKLALDAGFATCWDFGGADKVELLEKFALSWINLAIMQGHGRGLAFKVLQR